MIFTVVWHIGDIVCQIAVLVVLDYTMFNVMCKTV
ncbi:DUF1056 family protein [Alkalimarinus coralli]